MLAMRNEWWRKQQGLLQLGLGQLISFDLAVMGISSSSISTQVDAPLTTSFSTYLTLALVYGGIMLYRRQKILVPWYWYILLGFVDVHGNYLVNKAYEFTSLTSVALLDCWTIAWAILMTWIFLGTRYSTWQFLGCAICLGGLLLVLFSDTGVGGGGGSNPILGDFLAIAGTFFFGMSSVGEEFCVKRKDRIEVVTMIGVFGMIVSACEIAVIERKTLESVKWSTELLLSYGAYAASSFMFYTLVPYLLQMSGATMFNLSLLTSDMWAVAFRIFIYKQKVDWLYYVAFLLVVIGIFIYTKTEENADCEIGAPEYSLIDEEISRPQN